MHSSNKSSISISYAADTDEASSACLALLSIYRKLSFITADVHIIIFALAPQRWFVFAVSEILEANEGSC